jgi:replicative DNA helicase
MESGSTLFETVEAAADVVMHLVAGDVVEGDLEEMTLVVEKNRNGDTGQIQLVYQDKVTEFRSGGEFDRNLGADSTSA